MEQLATEALVSVRLIPSARFTGEFDDDLRHLLKPLATSLNERERAFVGLLERFRRSAKIKSCVEQVFITPLRQAVAGLLRSCAARGHAVLPSRAAEIELVVRGLWWDRYILGAQQLSPQELSHLIESLRWFTMEKYREGGSAPRELRLPGSEP